MRKALREKKLLERLIHNPDLKLARDFSIIKKIRRLNAYKQANVVAFYIPVHGEINLIPLFLAHRSKKTFLLPKSCSGRTLKFHEVKNLNELRLGKYKIPEPPDSNNDYSHKTIDLIFIPGLAFDAKGNRLGYGKGYYDSFLAKISCLKIGIAYDFQLVKNIHAGKKDIPMDLVITDKRTIRPE